ncbi:MAG: hypothetical protein K2P99_05030, partial [Burkholderiales bacterium]|nr:hypothetical protein [Burkholderiales bacterium]
MASYIKPDYGGYDDRVLNIFNISYFSKLNSTYATMADLLKYGRLAGFNNWTGINNFVSLNFFENINGISSQIFDYIRYVPAMLYDLSNINYNDTLDETTITGTTILENGIC